jgi:pentatricopeptide repeat protein
VTYAILLTHFSRGDDWDRVDRLLEEMHGKGMPARTPIYAAYLRHLCRGGDWNKALSLYLVMRELGAEVTTGTYWEVMQVCDVAARLSASRYNQLVAVANSNRGTRQGSACQSTANIFNVSVAVANSNSSAALWWQLQCYRAQVLCAPGAELISQLHMHKRACMTHHGMIQTFQCAC